MGLGLYTLKKKGFMVLKPDGDRETVYILQLVATNALSQDVQEVVDRAIKSAYRVWESVQPFPELVAQVGMDGIPHPGVPIFTWSNRRVYCFEDDLLNPAGFLGNREISGFLFRTVEEQRRLDDFTSARGMDKGPARVYRDFWSGETFRSGEEFLAYRRGLFNYRGDRAAPNVVGRSARSMPHPRLAKILNLIKHIEVKGRKASTADIQYLNHLRAKAAQLGHLSN